MFTSFRRYSIRNIMKKHWKRMKKSPFFLILRMSSRTVLVGEKKLFFFFALTLYHFKYFFVVRIAFLTFFIFINCLALLSFIVQSDYDNFEVCQERKEGESISRDFYDNGTTDPGKKPSQKKRRRNSRFLERVLKKKPLFNPGFFFWK